MKPKNSYLKEYVRVTNCIDADDTAKQQIIIICAKHSTLQKIKAGKYKVTAVRKEKSTEQI